MLKRIVAVLATAVLAVGLALGATLPASAHDANYAANCGSLDLNLVYYGAGKSNFVTVTIDGTKVENNTKFGDSFTKSYTWAPGTAHTYKIEITAQDRGYDKTITGTSTPCTAVTQCFNPMSQLKGFTILTEGAFTNSTSGAHVEGTIAVGGDLVLNNRYTTQNNHDGSPIPVVDGQGTGLLVGGKTVLNADGQAFLVMSGVARIGDVPATAAMTEGGKRYRPVASTERYVEVTSATTLDAVKAPGLFASTFSSAFATMKTQADAIASYSGADVQFVTMTTSPNGGKQVTLNAGVTNVLRVSASTLSSAGQLWFAGNVVPSASTPFIIDVTDAGSFNVTAPTLRNIDPSYVLWNFSKATSIGLNTSEFVKGSILAPRAALSVNSGGIEGQIAAASVVIKSVGEIHHIAYKPCVTPPQDVKGSASATPQICDTNYALQAGAVTANAATGVVYELWKSDKSSKIAALTAGTAYPISSGDYVVKVLPASSAYTVSAANTWIPVTVGAFTDVCAAPAPVKGAATASDQVCDAKDYVLRDGAITTTAKMGVTYELWNAARTSKLADLPSGAAYKVASGSYSVKVLPTSSAYTVASADQWIDLTVAAFADDCTAPTPVKGAATATAQVCDADYNLQQGSVTATANNGVVYQLWSADRTTKIADLTAGTAYRIASGDYAVRVLAASKGFTVASADEWIAVTVSPYTGVCAQSVSGAATTSAEVCDVNFDVQQGSITATVKTGVLYELWNAAKTTKIANLTPGAAFAVDGGDYAVKVVPFSSKYVVDAANEWIGVTVGDYTGICAQSVSGAATTSAEVCDVNYDVQQGSITATAKTGVRYELWNAAKTTKIADLTAGTPYSVDGGDYSVKVVPETAKFTVAASDEWLPVTVADYTGLCAQSVTGAATTTSEVCDATYQVQQGSITATAKAGVAYELWTADKSSKISDLVAGTAYAVDGGSYAVKVLPTTAKYTVAADDQWLEVTVGDYTGDCSAPTRVSGAATTAGEVCAATPGAVDQGSVTAVAATGVTYELWNAAKTTKIADLTAGTAYLLDGGSYFVKVLPASSKFTVDAADTWIAADVAENTTVCDVIGDPVLTQGCVANPNDLEKSDWKASLTIVGVKHVQYRVYFQDGSNWIDQGVWNAGVYTAGTAKLPYATTVKVVAEAETGWNLLAPKSWTYTLEKAKDCNLPTLGTVDPEVTFGQTCTVGSTYTLSIDGGVEGTVLWSVNGGPQTTKLGTFAAPSGKVTIVATPAPGAGFNQYDPAPGSTTRTFTHTFGTTVLCDLETLALTGQNVAGPALAGFLLLQVGLVLVAVRFVRTRKARHLA